MADVTESKLVEVAEHALASFCTGIEREYDIGNGMRVDLKAELSNGQFVLVEVKAFDETLTPYVEGIIQACSYADAIKYPVFIGPISGSRMSVSSGKLDNALAALHLLGGRLNVGFLCTSSHGYSSLILRGQRMADAGSLHSEFDSHWFYGTRSGSKTDRLYYGKREACRQ